MTKEKGDLNQAEFLDTQETSALIKIPKKSIYCYVSRNGVRYGKKRKRLPKRLYRRIGSRLIFIKSELLNWIINENAEFEVFEPEKEIK